MIESGTQVIYVPLHADGPDHPDCEEGFVTSFDDEQHVWCRFWHKIKGHENELRTTLNSECCYERDLVIRDTRPQEFVDETLVAVEALRVKMFGEWRRRVKEYGMREVSGE